MGKAKVNRYQKNLRQVNKQKRQEEEARLIREDQERLRLEDLERIRNMTHEDFLLQLIGGPKLTSLLQSATTHRDLV